MNTFYECADCREIVGQTPEGLHIINARTTRTRFGRFVHGLLRHGVWASSSYYERALPPIGEAGPFGTEEDA